MANTKISELTALTPPAAADELAVVDVSATSTKKTTVGEVVGIITGDVEVASNGTATISELPVSKLQDGDARQLLQTDAAGTGVEWTSNVDVPGTLDVTGATALDLTLGVSGQSTLASAAVSDLTSGRVVLAGTSGELEDNAGLTFNGTQLDVDGDVVITGDLTVEGTTTTIESQTLTVKDKNIELGVVASPTDVTADGGGITLKGATDKTINWLDSTDAWTLSEHVNIASAKEYRIDGTKVLDATSLGSAVVSSSLTSVGTIGTGVWNGTAIATAYIADSAVTSAKIADDAIVNADINASAAIADTKLGTISTAGKVSNSATTATNANTASAIVARDGSGNFAAGTVTAALTGNASTATALETARNFAVTGDVTGTVSSDLTSGASIATSIASGVIVNADINASAAIAGTKIDPDFGSQTVKTTGIFSAAGGSAAAPSIAFTGDTNTGIYSPGANQVAVATNGAARLYIASNGNVGIATTSPSSLLHLNSNSISRGNGGLRIATADSNESYVTVGVSTSLDTAFISSLQNGSGSVRPISFVVGTSSTQERMRIDTSGRLLVGTSSDSGGALLQVNDNRIRIATAKTPASASDTGTAGEICWDADYIYVCTATNTWKRTAISTW
jgi:hypothetical protein